MTAIAIILSEIFTDGMSRLPVVGNAFVGVFTAVGVIAAGGDRDDGGKDA